MPILEWSHKTQFENSTIQKQEYFAGVSDDSLMKTITHTYYNNIAEIKGRVESYVGHHIHPDTHDSKIREAYQRIKQPKFVTVKEILKILK